MNAKPLAFAAAVSLVVPSAFAQRHTDRVLPPGAEILSTSNVAVHAIHDLDTGRTKLARPRPASLASGAGASPCFDYSYDDDGVWDALLYPAGHELLDWGVKSCGGSGFVERIGLAYTSRAVPTSQGGPGGALTLRVYKGATGHGAPGTLVASIDLTGLYSDTSFPGIVSPVFLEVDLGAQSFYLPDGPIGWSYSNPDGDTAPLLIDFDPALGGENAYDHYTPPPATGASYVGTFQLPPGGISNDPKENSFVFQVFENDTPAVATFVALGANPILFSADRPIVGRTWTTLVDLSGLPGAKISYVAVATSALSNVNTPAGALYIDPRTIIAGSVGVIDVHRFAIPSDSGLVGTRFYAQGAFVPVTGGVALTNGLRLVLGTF